MPDMLHDSCHAGFVLDLTIDWEGTIVRDKL